ncbi:MAG: tyrosine-type recombinase/integrase [Deltaproteobacteria bacterium]|nr:tyrosine-type recombinase/integrase [Deltaproteobacteria bacterium]
MAENKLTDRELRRIKPSDKEQLVGDGGGLWVRVLPIEKGGAMNFYYRFEFGGKERRYNCGTFPETSLAIARENRNAARNLVKSGIDPVVKESLDRASRAAAQTMETMEKTVTELFEDWKRVYLVVHRKDGGKEVEAIIRHDLLPVIGTMKAKEVKLAHVVQAIDKVLDRGARRKANILLSLTRQMFRHGMGRGIVETDPTLALSKKHAGGKEVPVDRNLSCEEIKELNEKLTRSDLHGKYQSAIWFLLATGARVGELVKARWVDIDTTARTWKIPAENSKNGRPHVIHLSLFARKQLSVFASFRSGPYLLAGGTPRRKKAATPSQNGVVLEGGTNYPMSEKTISKSIRDRIRSVALKRRSPAVKTLLLTGGEWSPHDLRRTMASRMGDIGIQPHVIERCLNHVPQGIVGVYQRQEYMPERKAAFRRWGIELMRIVRNNKEGTNE